MLIGTDRVTIAYYLFGELVATRANCKWSTERAILLESLKYGKLDFADVTGPDGCLYRLRHDNNANRNVSIERRGLTFDDSEINAISALLAQLPPQAKSGLSDSLIMRLSRIGIKFI